MTETRQYTTATYRVAVEKQDGFLELLEGCEGTMRQLGLITSAVVSSQPTGCYRLEADLVAAAQLEAGIPP